MRALETKTPKIQTYSWLLKSTFLIDRKIVSSKAHHILELACIGFDITILSFNHPFVRADWEQACRASLMVFFAS